MPADDFFWNLTETSGLDAAYDITCLQIWIFPLPHGPPSKPKEILIALIPNQSIFIQYQDSCNYTHRPRAHNWNPTFHSSELSFLASVLRLSLLLFSIRGSWCWFCLSYTHCLPFSLDSLSDLCLYWLFFFSETLSTNTTLPQGWNVPDSGVIVIKCVLSLLHKALMRGRDQRHGTSSPQLKHWTQ